jgi:hypothetical protein
MFMVSFDGLSSGLSIDMNDEDSMMFRQKNFRQVVLGKKYISPKVLKSSIDYFSRYSI